MSVIIKRVWNQNKLVNIESLHGMTFQAEDGGHVFQISGIDDTGAAVALSGTVAGVFRRPDNADIALTGSASEGVVSVTITNDCYAVPGRFGLVIYVTSGGNKTAVYACIGTVAQTNGGAVAGSTPQDVVDLINAIAAAVATIPPSYTDLIAAIAPIYSNSAIYPVGSYAWYDGKLYRCTTAITTPETWTAAHWTEVPISAGLDDMNNALRPLAGCIEFESGGFKNDRITKEANVKRIRNVSPIPIRNLYSINLPEGYTMFAFFLRADMSVISSSPGTTRKILYNDLLSGNLLQAYYVNMQITKTDAPDDDISSYVSTLNSDTVIIRREDTDDSLSALNRPADAKAAGDLFVKLAKIVLGANPDRKALDHGGFWSRPSESYMEDSPLAFLRAAREGIKYHDIDIICTSDGVPIVSHGNTVVDTEGNSHVISQNTYAQVRTWEIGNSTYSFNLMTLANLNEYLKKLGGVIDLVDVSYMTDAQAGQLKSYYNLRNIRPNWTNFDSETQRTLFKNSSGGDFGIFMSCESTTDIESALTYIQNNPGVKYALSIYASSSGIGPAAVEPYLSSLRALGVAIYVFIYNTLTNNPIPGWADGVLSETINVNYEEWSANINA